MTASPSTKAPLRLLMAVAVAAGFAQFAAVAALNDVARAFGHHVAGHSLVAKVGLGGSALGVGLALLRVGSLAALPLASLGDHHGRVRTVQRWLAIGLSFTVMASAAPNYWIFVALFAVARPFFGAVGTLAQVVTVELHDHTRRLKALSYLALGAGFGAGMSAVVHGALRGGQGFRALFALALVPLVLLVPFIRRIPESLDREGFHEVSLGRVPRSLRSRVALVATVAFGMGVVSGPANGFAFVYAEGVLNLHAGVVSSVVTLSALTGVLGLWLGRRSGDVWGRRRTVALGALAVTSTSLLAYNGSAAAFVVGYLLGVGAAGFFSPAMSGLATEIVPSGVRATAAGWVTLAAVTGAVTGLLIFGALAGAQHSGALLWRPALWTFLPALASLAALLFVAEPEREFEVH